MKPTFLDKLQLESDNSATETATSYINKEGLLKLSRQGEAIDI